MLEGKDAVLPPLFLDQPGEKTRDRPSLELKVGKGGSGESNRSLLTRSAKQRAAGLLRPRIRRSFSYGKGRYGKIRQDGPLECWRSPKEGKKKTDE